MKKPVFNSKLDFFGMFASLLCAVHCIAIPVLVALGAMGGLAFLQDPLVEKSFLALSAVIAILSLLPSYKNKHQRKEALGMALVGFLFLGAGHEIAHEVAWEHAEAASAALGGTLVAAAHWMNQKLLREFEESSESFQPHHHLRF